MIYRHFFWDFDGTLYDTYPRITRACQRALGDFCVETAYDTVYAAAKRSLNYCGVAIGGPRGVSAEAFMEAYHRHAEEEGAESIRPYSGVPEMLRAVVRNGGKNYLYTHRSTTALKWPRHDRLDALFADAVTKEDGFPSKPAPDALNYLIEKHRLDRAQCVMLGDRDIDLDAGKNAGIACALFDPENFYPSYDTPWRFQDMKALQKALLEEGKA